MNIFSNKIAVITGASSGIGKAMAQSFDSEGAQVALFARDEAKLASVAKTLHNPCITVPGDITSLGDIDRLYKTVNEKLGKIDILVANAGIALRAPLDQVTEAMYDSMMDTNVKGVFFTVQQALPYLNDGASIILISSMATQRGWADLSVYSAAKAAVTMLARNFSADLVHRGIRVNSISPGYTDTPMFSDREVVANMSETVPLGRFAKPEEIAKAAMYLSSPDATYIIGIDLLVDGGVTTLQYTS
jgi:NAD(P)-dependent dehydrogenase (short-subunit alcohol dehydrogenase family)